ncbi:MAG: hypothetical protein ACRC2R_08515 [Xenococcaceae cyanobacterium]
MTFNRKDSTQEKARSLMVARTKALKNRQQSMLSRSEESIGVDTRSLEK